MDTPRFEYIIFTDGSSPFVDYLNSLPVKEQEKLLAIIIKVEEYGLEVAKKMKWIKKLEDNLYELRSQMGNNIQRAIYFHEIRGEYKITHGFSKKTQKTPILEIDRAKSIKEKYLRENEKR